VSDALDILKHDRFVAAYIIHQELSQNEFREGRKKDFLLNGSVFQNSPAEIFIGKIHDY
jgi:hypothetical protein